MIPKKVYLRAKELEEHFMCERMVSCDTPIGSCNVEYTDLSQLWHDVKEEPKNDEDIVLYDSYGNFVTEFYNGYVAWDNIVSYYKVTMWAYIEDILPKGGER